MCVLNFTICTIGKSNIKLFSYTWGNMIKKLGTLLFIIVLSKKVEQMDKQKKKIYIYIGQRYINITIWGKINIIL